MAERYLNVSSKDLRIGETVSFVGRFDGNHESGVFLSDNLSKLKIINISKHLAGIIEVRGNVTGNNQIECHNYTQWEDEDFDFEFHRKMIQYFKRFPDLASC